MMTRAFCLLIIKLCLFDVKGVRVKQKIIVAIPFEPELISTIEKWAFGQDFSNTELVFIHFVRQEYSGYEMTVVTYPDDLIFSEMRPVLMNHFQAVCRKMLKPEIKFHIEVHLSPSPADSMIKILSQHRADLVVVATRGKSGLAGFFGSSFADHMSKFSPCDLLVLRPRD